MGSALEQLRWIEAEAAYRAELAKRPNAVDVHNELGKVLARLGKKEEALAAFKRCVELAPAVAEGHNNLGNVLREFGGNDQAIAEYRRALELDPNYALAHYNLGNTLRGLGKTDQAIGEYREAIRLHPAFAEAHNNLGNALGDLGRWEEAAAAFRRAIEINPNHAIACNNLAGALNRLGKTDEAEHWLRRALQIQPNYATAISSLGTILAAKQQWSPMVAVLEQGCRLVPQSLELHVQLAEALRTVDRFSDAVVAARQAVAIKPDSSDAINALGHSLWSNGEFKAAEQTFLSALTIRPDDASAIANLAAMAGDRGDLQQALTLLQKALQIRPIFPDALRNCAVALADLNRFDEAMEYYRKAIEIQPDFPEARHGIALIHLVRGNFEEGWKEYEWRRRLPGRPRPFPHMEWKGQDWKDHNVVLLDEEGLGDSIQFVRYAQLVANKGANVTVVCAPALAKLMSLAKGIGRVISRGKPVDRHDFHVPLLSLPFAIGTRLDTIPAEVPYIVPAAEEIARFSHVCATSSSFKVGLSWAGNPAHKKDRYRSIPPGILGPLSNSGATFFSLQKTTAAPRFSGMPPFPCQDLAPELHDLADTAAAIANLDLVITVDTSVAHLAGAMGKPVWVFIPFAPDWRWLLDREDSPWYPTMRLFRQKQIGDWSEAIARAAQELSNLVALWKAAQSENSGGSGAANVIV